MQHQTIPNQPTVTTDRFTLRPVRMSDAGLMHFYASDLRLARTTRSIPHPLPEGATEALLRRATDPDRTEFLWAMDASAQGGAELLGVISLDQLDRDQSEIGYWVAPALWNTGFASEAVTALIEANPLKNRTIFASVHQDNPGSARVLTNAGFDYIGDAEAFSVARGAKVATWTYLKRLG